MLVLSANLVWLTIPVGADADRVVDFLSVLSLLVQRKFPLQSMKRFRFGLVILFRSGLRALKIKTFRNQYTFVLVMLSRAKHLIFVL